MIVEIVLENEVDLNIEGLSKIDLVKGYVLYNPSENRVEALVKRHPDGKVSVFTDKIDIIRKAIELGRVIDVHFR